MDKNTVIYSSFSSNPGSLGSVRFNHAFQKNGINAVYFSRKIDCISEGFMAAKILGFGGFTISMPFKEKALDYCDILEKRCKDIKSVNTVILNKDGKFIGYNTDALAISEYIKSCDIKEKKEVIIIGMGSYARTANYAFEEIGYNVSFLNSRSNYLVDNLGKISDSIIFNASPLTNLSKYINYTNLFIDCDTNEDSGRKLSYYNAKYQFYGPFGYNKDYIFEEVVV